MDRRVAVVPEVVGEQLRAVRDQPYAKEYIPSPKTLRVSPVSRSRIHTSMSAGVLAFAEYASFVPSGENAPAPTKCCTSGSSVICSGQPLSRVEKIELVELVAVSVGGEHDRAVPRRDGDLPHGLLGERGQLVRPATADGDAPEVELPGDVADEEHVLPVARERQAAAEAAVRGEALEGGELRRCAYGRHAPDDSGYGSRRMSSRSMSWTTRCATCSVITPSRLSWWSTSRSAAISSRRRRW